MKRKSPEKHASSDSRSGRDWGLVAEHVWAAMMGITFMFIVGRAGYQWLGIGGAVLGGIAGFLLGVVISIVTQALV